MSDKFRYEESLKEAVRRIKLEYKYKCKDFNMNCHECQMNLAVGILEDELMLLKFFNKKKVLDVKEEVDKFLKGFAYKKK